MSTTENNNSLTLLLLIFYYYYCYRYHYFQQYYHFYNLSIIIIIIIIEIVLGVITGTPMLVDHIMFGWGVSSLIYLIHHRKYCVPFGVNNNKSVVVLAVLPWALEVHKHARPVHDTPTIIHHHMESVLAILLHHAMVSHADVAC